MKAQTAKKKPEKKKTAALPIKHSKEDLMAANKHMREYAK